MQCRLFDPIDELNTENIKENQDY